MTLSPELQVLFRPAAVFEERIGNPDSGWTALRRPLFTMLVVACAISLMTSGRITIRLAGPAFVYWAFVPLCEIAGLALVWRRKVPFSQAIDVFFVSNAPALFWLIAYAALFAFASPIHAFAWTQASVFDSTLLVMSAWTAYLDFRFFRIVFQRTRAQAVRDLLVQRAVSWVGMLVVFAWSSIWPTVLPRLGL
jgi:hypothetical protein